MLRIICARASALPRAAAAARRAPPARALSAVPASLVKALRERTGAPISECAAALAASGADVEAAVDWLRKKGVSVANKKAGRAAAQGLVALALADDGSAGALVEVRGGGGGGGGRGTRRAARGERRAARGALRVRRASAAPRLPHLCVYFLAAR
jgi:hypothetical protein